MCDNTKPTVCIVGLGYVGMPLLIAFSEHVRVIGIDTNPDVVNRYKPAFPDSTITTNWNALTAASVVLVAVPTPVYLTNEPDLTPLLSACESVGKHMSRGATIVFESTVYPGATETICIPALEQASGFKWKHDFNVGYSPERVVPGRGGRPIQDIVKLVAGDSPHITSMLAELYGLITNSGIHTCQSIIVAESAKLFENVQRDVNIALVNEFAQLCSALGVATKDVLQAMNTKWNHLPFVPGLVGGHCIGVDPYYLIHKANELKVPATVATSARQTNDSMSTFISTQTIKTMLRGGINVPGSTVVVLGFTFKENCADVRNTKVNDIVVDLNSYGVDVVVHDPIASSTTVADEYGIHLYDWSDLPRCHAIVLAVDHDEYRNLSMKELSQMVVPGGVVIDVKSKFNASEAAANGLHYWCL